MADKRVKLFDGRATSPNEMTVPDSPSGTLVTLADTQTLTNKTLTSPVLGSTVTGTYTLAGTPTFTSPTINTPTIATPTVSGLILSDQKRSTADFTATSGDTGTTLTNLTGLTGFTLTASAVYEFEVNLRCVCTTNSGISVAFKLTTATLTSISLMGTTVAASSLAHAQSTTTTDQTRYVNTKAAAWLNVILRGTLVVGTGGTVAIQASQESAHADATTVYTGSYARFTRLS